MQYQPPTPPSGPPRSPPPLRASLAFAAVPLVVLLALQWPFQVLVATLAAATTAAWCAIRRPRDHRISRVRSVDAVSRR